MAGFEDLQILGQATLSGFTKQNGDKRNLPNIFFQFSGICLRLATQQVQWDGHQTGIESIQYYV